MAQNYQVSVLTKGACFIAAAVLLACLAPMPYGYYTLARWIAAVAFCLVAYNCRVAGRNELCVVCVAAALLFQPFFNLSLGRIFWSIADVVAAGFLLGYLKFCNAARDAESDEE